MKLVLHLKLNCNLIKIYSQPEFFTPQIKHSLKGEMLIGRIFQKLRAFVTPGESPRMGHKSCSNSKDWFPHCELSPGTVVQSRPVICLKFELVHHPVVTATIQIAAQQCHKGDIGIKGEIYGRDYIELNQNRSERQLNPPSIF